MRQVPGVVAIVASMHQGQRGGLTATAWAPVTADPPTLLVCVNQAASAHELILASGKFSINVLDSADVETAAIFSAQRGLDGEARFSHADWFGGSGGMPLLASAVAAFECQVASKLACGTHTVLIGEVMAALCREDADALLYIRRVFASARAS